MTEGEPEEEPEGTLTQRVSQLLIEANDLYEQADAALAERDLAKYQELNEQAREKTREAERLLEAEGAASTTSTSTTQPASA